MPENLSYSASQLNLRRLLVIRCLVLVSMALAVFYSSHYIGIALPTVLLSSAIGFLLLLTALSFWRLHYQWIVTDVEYFAQLLVDIFGLSLLLYLSGGATNPFISYYLVPLVISASVLPWAYTWIIAGLSLAAYSGLLFFHIPVAELNPHGMHQGSMNFHITGMWLNFALSAALITFFVVRMATALRIKETQESEQREDLLRNEQILAVARLAAGTAHELGTPLSTMAVLTETMKDSGKLDNEQQQDLDLLEVQIQHCKDTLNQLVQTAQLSTTEEKWEVSADEFIESLWQHWQMMRPQVSTTLNKRSSQPAPILKVDATLEQAITNLLNNAADACAINIELNLDWNDSSFELEILDNGPGLPPELAQQIGNAQIKPSDKGLGLGLLLSHATINRYKGQIKIENRQQGGTRVQLTLPHRGVASAG